MRRFELYQGTPSRFWQIQQQENVLEICHGVLETAGEQEVRPFATPVEAAVALEVLVTAHLNRGYLEVVSDPADHAGALLPPCELQGAADRVCHESYDQQTRRALLTFLDQMITGKLAPDVVLDVETLCSQYHIGEPAALQFIYRAGQSHEMR